MDHARMALDAAENLWDAFGDWLADHETQADVLTVWVLVIGFTTLAIVKGVTWWTISRQHDRTDVGRSLKRQKVAETVMFACLALLYGASLALYYSDGGMVLGVWQRMGIRLILAAGIVAAAIAGLRFVAALRAQNYGQPDREARQDAREVRQDARTVAQDKRGVAQDKRDAEWDAR